MSDTVKVDRKLLWAQNAIETIRAHNKSSGDVVAGDVVILDTANSSGTEVAFTTTASADNKLVLGMAIQTIADNGYGQIQTKGPTSALKVNGSTIIVAGDHLATYSTAKIGQKAGSGLGGAFAIALTGYSTANDLGVIEAYLTGSAARIDTSSLSATFSNPTITGTLSVSATTTFTSASVITMTGVDSATDTLILTEGDILISDGHLDVIEANGTVDVFTLEHTTGAITDDDATFKIIEGGNLASGANMLRLNPTGTPNAASILFEIVGGGKVGQAMYVNGDSTGIDVVHFLGGGVLTDGYAVLGITNGGNIAAGGALLHLAFGGAPVATAIALEIDAQKDSIAMFIDSDAAANSAVQITGNGIVADNKAMLDVTNTAAIAVGSSLVRIHSTTASAGATAYGLEIAMNNTNLEALYVSQGTSRFDELIRMNGTSKIEFLDTGLYIYSSANGVLDIVSDTTVAITGAVTASSTLIVTGDVTANNTTASTSVTSGALVSKGGLGVASALFIGGDISIATGQKITTTAELTLNSVDPLTFQIGGVDWMKWDEAAINSFVAENDTLGHAAYIETEDGGGSAAAAGKAGGLYNFKTGDGSAAGGSSNYTGGAGGAFDLVTGAGAAGATANGVGGAGGTLTITTGAGAAGAGTGTGGAGGALGLTGGVGAQTADSTGTSGAGGAVVITSGAGGAGPASAGGTAGAGGNITLTPGAPGAQNGGVVANQGLVGIANSSTTAWAPSSIADGDEEAKEITVKGASLGDFVLASMSVDVLDVTLTACVTASNTVTATLANNTGSGVSIASGTLAVVVVRKA